MNAHIFSYVEIFDFWGENKRQKQSKVAMEWNIVKKEKQYFLFPFSALLMQLSMSALSTI